MKGFFFSSLLLFLIGATLPVEGQLLKKIKDKISESTAPQQEDNQEIATEESSQKLPEYYKVALTGSGPDLFFSYRMNLEGEAVEQSQAQIEMNTEMYYSPSRGKGRSEMIMNMPILGEMKYVALTDTKQPMQITVLNERKKQYSIIDLSDSDKKSESEVFTVTKLGEENLHGLHCKHARATSQDGQSFEIWTTTEVPGYEKMVDFYSKTQQTGSNNLWKALQEKDCAGFLVKLKVNVDKNTSIMELTSMKKITADDTLFEVPSGYKEKSGGWVKRYMKNFSNR